MILSPTAPREEILRTCRLLVAAGEIHEVRSPKSGPRGTISGYFDDPETLATFRRKIRFDVNLALAHGVKNSKLPDGRPAGQSSS